MKTRIFNQKIILPEKQILNGTKVLLFIIDGLPSNLFTRDKLEKTSSKLKQNIFINLKHRALIPNTPLVNLASILSGSGFEAHEIRGENENPQKINSQIKTGHRQVYPSIFRLLNEQPAVFISDKENFLNLQLDLGRVITKKLQLEDHTQIMKILINESPKIMVIHQNKLFDHGMKMGFQSDVFKKISEEKVDEAIEIIHKISKGTDDYLSIIVSSTASYGQGELASAAVEERNLFIPILILSKPTKKEKEKIIFFDSETDDQTNILATIAPILGIEHLFYPSNPFPLSLYKKLKLPSQKKYPRNKIIFLALDSLGTQMYKDHQKELTEITKMIGSSTFTFKNRSVFPTTSKTNWASMFSGLSPNKHLILDINEHIKKGGNGKNNSYQKSLMTIFDLFQKHNRSTAVFSSKKLDFAGKINLQGTTWWYSKNKTNPIIDTIDTALQEIKKNYPDITVIYLHEPDQTLHEKKKELPQVLNFLNLAIKKIREKIFSFNPAPILILTSDHGSIKGDTIHGSWLEETKYTPLIIETKKGNQKEIAYPTSKLNIFPTLNFLAGISPRHYYSRGKIIFESIGEKSPDLIFNEPVTTQEQNYLKKTIWVIEEKFKVFTIKTPDLPPRKWQALGLKSALEKAWLITKEQERFKVITVIYLNGKTQTILKSRWY